jgi:hypothetical protein
VDGRRQQYCRDRSRGGRPDHNGPFDFLWSTGSVAIAWAAWFPNAETRSPSEVFGWRAIVLPLGAQLLAILAIGAAQIIISRPRPSKGATTPIDLDVKERT